MNFMVFQGLKTCLNKALNPPLQAPMARHRPTHPRGVPPPPNPSTQGAHGLGLVGGGGGVGGVGG